MENVFHPNGTSSVIIKKCNFENEYIERGDKVSAIVSVFERGGERGGLS